MTEQHTPEAGGDRPEALIRTPESDHHDGALPDDEDLGLRLDTEEWQEYPSPAADPAAPESVEERMTGPGTKGAAERGEDGAGRT